MKKHNIFVATLGLVILAGGSVIGLRYQQGQIINQANSLVTAVNLNNYNISIIQLKDKKKQLQDAINLLKTIPNFPTSRYREANLKISQFQSELNSIEQTFQAKASENLATAKKLQQEVTQTLDKLPLPVNILEQTKIKQENAINLLEVIPLGTSVFGEARQMLKKSRSQQSLLDEKIEIEKKAIASFQLAQKLATEAVKIGENPPHSVAVWEKAANKWQEALSSLQAIPAETTVFKSAEKTLATYSDNYTVILSKIQAEHQANKLFETAKQIAQQASSLTPNPPYNTQVWQQAQQTWQQAINTLKNIPNGTTLSNQAKNKIAEYNKNLQIVNQELEKQKIVEIKQALIPYIQARIEIFYQLNYRLEVGINYLDYGYYVRQLKVNFEQLGRIAYVKELASYQNLEKAMNKYELAYQVWTYYLESDESNNFISASSEYGQLLIKYLGVEQIYIVNDYYISLDTALAVIWNRAAEDIVEAQRNL